MKVAMAQMRISQNMKENYRRSLDCIADAALKGADLICFSEIQLTPFFPQYENKNVDDYVIKLDNPIVRGFMDACRENQIYAAPNFYIEENGKRYDVSILIDDLGHIIGKQKMVHIAQAEQFFEQDYYTPSEEGFGVFETKFGKIGIVICFDRHYSESIRTSVLKGAELILIPTVNTKKEPSEMFQWEIKVQAFQNSVNIAMCNRVGIEDQMEFSGESIVSDYLGNTVLLADDQEGLFLAEVDLQKARETRSKKPYTNLRRPELYK